MAHISDAIYNIENYTASILASTIGLNETIGASMLVKLGISSALNTIALRKLKLLENETSLSKDKQFMIARKIENLKAARRHNAKTAAAMGLLLVPFIGGILARNFSDLTGAYASTVSDVISLLGKNQPIM